MTYRGTVVDENRPASIQRDKLQSFECLNRTQIVVRAFHPAVNRVPGGGQTKSFLRKEAGLKGKRGTLFLPERAALGVVVGHIPELSAVR